MVFPAVILYNRGKRVCKFKLREKIFIRNLRLIDKPPLFCYHKTTQREERYGFWRTTAAFAPPVRSDPGAVCRGASGLAPGGEQVGKRSFPKLKIPHQSHADFCSTDTAGGLDNKKRRYAPRGGVAYRLFLWGFPKGATPPFGTRLCEAKCSVLYALSALP